VCGVEQSARRGALKLGGLAFTARNRTVGRPTVRVFRLETPDSTVQVETR